MIKGIKLRHILIALAVLLLSASVIFVLYQAAVPVGYDISVGDRVTEDIVSTRSIVDRAATEQRALEQSMQIPDVMVRSERISNESIGNLEAFTALLGEKRQLLYYGKVTDPLTPTAAPTAAVTPLPGTTMPVNPAPVRRVPRQSELTAEAQAISKEILEAYGIELNTSDVTSLLSYSDTIYEAFQQHTLAIAELIMAGNHDSLTLLIDITSRVNELVANNTFYQNEYSLIATFLRQFLQANMVYDAAATRAAREAVSAQVKANPVLIPTGTRLVAAGERLTETQYQNLIDLDLVNTGEINSGMLISLMALYVLIMAMLWIYFRYYAKQQLRSGKDWLIAMTTVVFVIFISAYLAKLSPLLIPVYFVAIVLSTYFGLRTSLVITSMLILLLYPITSLNSQFFFVGIMGSWAAALITASQRKNRNYVAIIIGTTLVVFASSVLYSTMTQTDTASVLENAGFATLSGALSAVLAIGLSPIFDLLISSISPVKLIHLSEPSQPLLRRLFLEAPGTYQHSMMVANLAESAAERIEANALLVRVGAYYHDIGKTWNPQMFTENQQGFNPHSLLSTEESVRVIFRHVTAGEELARRYRLPQEIINFISTHHGTTVLSYFYSQACEQAKAKGLPQPSPSDFTYPGQIPMSRETGLFMLADTTEAAMKSAGVTHLDAAEKLIRKLVRAKMDQDQLVNSGLSFHDVEEIIQAFLQVYAGQFHERIKYPDAHPVPESTK